MSAVLEARSITLWRGETLLLDQFDLQVHPAEAVQLSGANGSGKTSLLRCLCGLMDFDEGDILWQQQPLRRVRERFAEALLYIGHKPGISGGLTPVENLRMYCHLTGSDASRIPEILQALSLAHTRKLPCSVLSAGQQRRVALARLQLQQRPLWILDEPLTSLDAAGLAWVAARIAEQLGRGGSVVFTTHQPLTLPQFAIRSVQLETLT